MLYVDCIANKWNVNRATTLEQITESKKFPSLYNPHRQPKEDKTYFYLDYINNNQSKIPTSFI